MSEWSPNVNSLDIDKKTLAENLTKKLVLFSALHLRSGHFVLISHIFTSLHVLISSSSLLIDFLSRCSSLFHLRVAPSLLDSVSSESQSYHRTTSLVCFGSVTLCHQIFFVLLCVNVMARFVNFFSTTSCTYMCFSITCFILPSPLLDAHAFAD